MMYGGGSSGGGDDLSRITMMAGLPLQRNPSTIGVDVVSANLSPQWNHQETRDFIAIRAELEKDFTQTKRNKTLWEIVSGKMKEKGYKRSPDQCKCKWKNLVNRYKGVETSDPENGKQCPFFNELHSIFTERAKNMHRMLIESEAGSSSQAKRKMKRLSGDGSSEDLSDDDDLEEEMTEDEQHRHKIRKRKVQRSRPGGGGNIQEILLDFMKQQRRLDLEWRGMMERRAQERREFEKEWRSRMEAMERERLTAEQAWREKEEHRRMREETRAEKWDAILTTLLNKMMRNDF